MSTSTRPARALDRRQALRLSVQALAAVALSACGAGTAASVTTTAVGSTTAAQPVTSAATPSTVPVTSASSAAPATTTTSSKAASSSTTASATASASAQNTPVPTPNPSYVQSWWQWDDPGYSKAIQDLNAKNPKLATAYVLSPDWSKKFLTIMSAGTTPPDLIMVASGRTVVDWAHKGLLANLGPYARTDKIDPADFWDPVWKENLYKNDPYCLSLEVDPNFPLIYNKDLLKQMGFDKPPTTIAELDDVNQKLYLRQGNGIARLGYAPPWIPYGFPITYFIMFGGGYTDLNDPNKPALDQPANVSALNWAVKYANEFGGYDAIQTFSKTWGPQWNAWYLGGMTRGELAMSPLVSANYKDLGQHAQGTAYADSFVLGQLPVADGVKPDPGWLGGWGLIIPKTSKRADDAWQVLQYLTATPEATDTWAELNGFLPGYRKSPYFSRHADDPQVGEYIKVLAGARYVDPVQPYWNDIPADATKGVTDALQGKADVGTALLKWQQAAEAALAKDGLI